MRAAPATTKKLRREPPQPYELAPDQRHSIEQRYFELAIPVEFDGIRTQIAAELGLPKSAVKRAISDLRRSRQLPSWWELQAYKGTEADLDRIRQAYLPHLPVPDIGIHKHIASELDMDQAAVYQGIRRIRAELRLPQYNPPARHEAATPVTANGARNAPPANGQS